MKFDRHYDMVSSNQLQLSVYYFAQKPLLLEEFHFLELRLNFMELL